MPINNKPFILKKSANKTLIPEDHVSFDERVESQVRFVQGANSYISIALSYEIIKQIYSYFHFREFCHNYSKVLFVAIFHDILVIMTAFWGFFSINSRSSKKIRNYFFALILMFFTRIALYIYMDQSINQVEEINQYCNQIFQGGLYIMQGIVEGSLLLLMVILIKDIVEYVQTWEQSTIQNDSQIQMK